MVIVAIGLLLLAAAGCGSSSSSSSGGSSTEKSGGGQKTIAGVKTRFLHPVNSPAGKRNRILINFHGGGFVVGEGDIVEAVPIASLTQTTVVAVDYRLGPEHPYPAALDDAVAVYKELLKTVSPAISASTDARQGLFLPPR